MRPFGTRLSCPAADIGTITGRGFCLQASVAESSVALPPVKGAILTSRKIIKLSAIRVSFRMLRPYLRLIESNHAFHEEVAQSASGNPPTFLYRPRTPLRSSKDCGPLLPRRTSTSDPDTFRRAAFCLSLAFLSDPLASCATEDFLLAMGRRGRPHGSNANH